MTSTDAPVPRMLLLNPGPVTLSPNVRAALTGADLCHREPEYRALQMDVQQRIARVYPAAAAHYRPILLAGSGTAAVEAMLGSLVPKDGRVLVLSNGVYGERMATMVSRQGRDHHHLKAPWTEAIDLGAVERILAAGPSFTHVAVVHHETTTGRLNDLASLGQVCRRYDVPLLLDAVSSFGAEDIAFEAWGIEACAATANKCLHGIPGIAFVLTRASALARPSGAVSLYLDLHAYARDGEQGAPPFTPAIQSLYGLQTALREFDEAGGQTQRRARYRALAGRVMTGLNALGITTLLAPADYSCVLASYRLPASMTYEALHDELKSAGFIIYAGQGDLGASMFRISTMGELTATDMDRLLAAIGKFCGPALPRR